MKTLSMHDTVNPDCRCISGYSYIDAVSRGKISSWASVADQDLVDFFPFWKSFSVSQQHLDMLRKCLAVVDFS